MTALAPTSESTGRLDGLFAFDRVDRETADAWSFTGYAAAWALDYGGDVILKGAFSRSLETWRASGNLPLVDSHSYESFRRIYGQAKEAVEDERGLFMRFEIVRSLDGAEALARIRGGFINGLSIGFAIPRGGSRRATPEEAKRGVERVLVEIQLREVSLVVFPMNDLARIASASTAPSRADTLASPDAMGELRAKIAPLLAKRDAERAAVAAWRAKTAAVIGPVLERERAKQAAPREHLTAQLRTFRAREAVRAERLTTGG